MREKPVTNRERGLTIFPHNRKFTASETNLTHSKKARNGNEEKGAWNSRKKGDRGGPIPTRMS